MHAGGRCDLRVVSRPSHNSRKRAHACRGLAARDRGSGLLADCHGVRAHRCARAAAGQSSWINVHPLFIHPGLTLSLASCSPRLTPPLSRCSPWVNTSAQQVFTLSQHLRSAAVHPSQSALSHSQAAAAIQNWSTYDPTHTPRSATMPPLTPPP